MSMGTSEGGNNTEVVRVWLLSGFQVRVGRRVRREDAWGLKKAKAVVKLLAFDLTTFGQRSLILTTPGGSSYNGWLTRPAYAGSCNPASRRDQSVKSETLKQDELRRRLQRLVATET